MALDLAFEEIGAGETVTIVGDNLAVVRYCASAGRLLRPELHAILDPALNRAASAGRAPAWMAVRRRYNVGADEAATAGCDAAATAVAAGAMQPSSTTRRH